MITLIKDYIVALLEYVGILIGFVPLHQLRLFYYRTFLNVKIGRHSTIHRGCHIRRGKIVIGDNVIIGEDVLLDGRTGLYIGNNVNFSSNVSVYSLQHDYNSPFFEAVGGIVVIEDNAWISCNSVILPGVTVHEGAVVGAMCLVNKDVPEYTLVGGVPFKIINKRNRDIQYKLKYHKPFF